jgi:glycosyltransferase involved in cell wall biosynthesis
MTTDTVGGVWTYTADLAKALASAGVEFALAAMGGRTSAGERRQLESRPNVQLHESDYKLEWMQDPWDDVAAAGEWLLDIEKSFQPDIIHLNGYAHASLPFRAPIIVVAHSCVLSWWQAVKREPAPESWDRYRREVTAGLRAADLVVAPSRAMLDALCHHNGALTSTQVIHNGRDATRYDPTHRKERFILSAGRLWDDAKNIAALAEVAPSLPWPIHVAGEDRHPDGSCAATDSLTLLGRLDEASLAEQFSRAAIYALPARYEPFGLSALEAALSGCALVLGDIPSLREIWCDAALFVPPNDHRALRDALIGLIKFPIERARLAKRGLRRAREYTPRRMAEQYLAAYQQLMQQTQSLSECVA